MITLGSTVKDKITGYIGVVIARTDWLTGCVRYGVQSKELKDGKPIEAQWFDELQLEAESASADTEPQKPRGGPMPNPTRSGDPQH